ncbi:transcriptional regulator, AraC family with amidase-like domain [Enhydrobacter aerosaccus]|uniref:Transcriptional regulator, AraC family with amidase-like domain n=1 Tax=Enhydrobacter aerosaccus TaxID=225324 RepID=A0A1T4K7W1_9HYPH|nr:GlxA family transcriptional regulator [Enhydrobacter aerosaccus]SJZ38512.1 transcriptional regulator, AraC family with amidase-like domain [Enhydrobacter aerosaccus]
MTKPRTVTILALPGVQLLDVSGPLDVFAQANVEAAAELYRLRIVTHGPREITSSSGLRLLADTVIGDKDGTPSHTLLVAGGPTAADRVPPPALLDWLRQQARAARRYGSVCTGAFVLAAAGLLDGKRITTHWSGAQRLAERYPEVQVDADAIHVRDGKLRTAAGVTAGLDLALALVEEDFGRELAMKVAAQLVMFFKRPGGQLQFSQRGDIAPAGRSILQEIQRWAAAHPAADLSVGNLAKRAGLSSRHFARLFLHEVGTTPAAWVEEVRIGAARRHLETGTKTPKQVAGLCGFANADTLRRTFARHVGVTPAEYRKRFAST